MAIFTAIATTVLAVVGVTSTFAIGVVAAGLALATSYGLSYAVKALSGDPKKEEETKQGFSTQGVLQAAGDVPRSFNLGYSSTAGSLVWATTHGHLGETPNAYLTQVIAISDLPAGTLQEIWVSGELVTLGAVIDANLGAPVLEYRKAGVDYLWIKYYDGTQVAADPLCVSISSVDRPYESTRIGVGITYVVATSLVEDTLFNGFPTFKFAVSGVKLYDPSKDTTVGGSGTHVYSNPATWGGDGDSNPAVQIYNILRGFSYGGEWLYGLQNMSAARLPVANWITQINKCRATITGESGLEATYRSGGQINVNARSADAIEAILTACQGRLSEIGGFYKIHLGEPDTASFSFTDGDILSTEQQVYRPFFALADSVNGIQGTYPDPEQGWNTATAPAYYRPDLEVIDGNRRLMANPAFDFVPYTAQVQRLQKSAVEEAQRARTHTLSLPPAYWIVEPGDVGSWTSVRNGYSSKLFRVDGIVDKANLDISASLTEVDPADYDWNHALEFTPVTVGPTLVLRPTAQAISGWTVTAYIIDDGLGSPRRPAILLAWDNTQAGIIGVEFEVRLQATGEVILRGRTDNYLVGSVVIASYAILPITTYEVRGKYIPNFTRDMDWTAWIPVTTTSTFLSLEDFDAAVQAMLAGIEQADLQALIDTENLIASYVANQDARNWLDRNIVHSEVVANHEEATASITTTSTALVDLEGAFASYQVTVAASFGDIEASVTTNAIAIATLDGQAAAQYAVTLDVNGYAIGFNLLNGGGGISSATFTVDKFQIAFPGVTGGAAVPVFTVANIGGSPKVGIRGDMVVDGSITTQTIAAGAITATQIAANTITANKITTGAITSDSGAIGALSVKSLSIGDNAATVPQVQSFSAVSISTTVGDIATFNLSIDTTGLSGKTIPIYATATIGTATPMTATVAEYKLYIDGVAVLTSQTQQQVATLSGAANITGDGSVMSVTVTVTGQLVAGSTPLPSATGVLFAMAAKR